MLKRTRKLTEWTPELERKFFRLVAQKAFGRLSLKGITEFERFSELRRQLKNPEVGFVVKMATSSFVNSVAEQLRDQKVQQQEIAMRLEVSPPAVSQMLNGKGNYTIETMAKIAHALNCELEIRLNPAN